MKELLAMGYREVEGKWLKPVGYHILMYDPQLKEWSNHFTSANEKIHCWNRIVFEGHELLKFIKDCEADTKTNSYSESKFEFLTRLQQMEILL